MREIEVMFTIEHDANDVIWRHGQLYVPNKDAKFTRSYKIYSQLRILVTAADFWIQMWYFWKQDFSALLMESIVL